MKSENKKEWQRYLYVAMVKIMGNPFDQIRYTVYFHSTFERATDRYYNRVEDARRGAAQIYNKIEKSLLGNS